MLKRLFLAAATSLALGSPALANDNTQSNFFPDTVYKNVETADQNCAYLDASSPSTETSERAKRAIDILAQSETGRALLKYGKARNITYCYNYIDKGGVVGTYNGFAKVLQVNADKELADEIETLIHELRHMWQGENGYHISSFYRPLDMVMIGKMKEADAQAHAALVINELEAAGFDIFEDIKNGYDYGNVFQAFSQYAGPADIDNPDAINKATRAAFDAWFKKDHIVAHYERSYIRSIAGNMQRTPRHYPSSYGFKEYETAKQLAIGLLPNGQNYLAATGGFDRNARLYAGFIPDNTKTMEDLLVAIDKKKEEFCATRPISEADLCAPYTTQPVTRTEYATGPSARTTR